MANSFEQFPVYVGRPNPLDPAWNAGSLQNYPIESVVPTNGEILVFNSTTQTWDLQPGPGIAPSGYLPLTGSTMLGPIISDPSASAPTNPMELINKTFCLTNFLQLTGGSVSGPILSTSATTPTDPTDLVNKSYVSNFLPLSGGTMLSSLIGSASASSPSSPSELVSKSYVDSQISGIQPKAPCDAASATNLSATYSNGTAGVGATLTSTVSTAFTTDGYSASLSDRILVAGQSTASQNGIYTVTTVGNGSTAWVLTRSTDFDLPSQITNGASTVVINGTLYAGSQWVCTTNVTSIGGDPIIFVELQPYNQLTAGNGISKSGNTISANINTSNLQFTASQINTIQNIATSSSPTFTGLTLSGLTASQAVVTNGSSVLTTLAYSSTPSANTLMQRDANSNSFSNNFVSGFTTTATTGGSLPLFASSTRSQVFTGSLAQTVVLPDATTLRTGWIFEFWNDSSQSLTIQNHSSVTLFTVPSGGYAYTVLTSSGSSAGVWDYRYMMPSQASYSSSGLNVGGSLTCTTLTSTSASANTLAYFNGSRIISSGSVTSNLRLTTGTLDTAQNIQTSSSPTFSNLTLTSLTPSQVIVAGSPMTTVAYSISSTANSLIERDSNANAFINNAVSGLTITPTAGAVFTLTNASSQNQVFAGSSTETVVLPDATTLSVGWNFNIWNDSTGAITLNTADGAPLLTIQAGAAIYLLLLSVSSVPGTWDYRWLLPSVASYGTAGLNVGGTLSATSGTFSNLSPQTVLYADSSKTLQSASVGTSLSLTGSMLNTVQDITTTSTPTFANVTLTAVTANSVLSINGSNQLVGTTIGSSLTYSSNTLNTVQPITTLSSPTFAGLTVSGLSVNALVATNGSSVLTSASVGSSLTFSGGILTTIQPILTSSSPTFSTITLTNLSNSLVYANGASTLAPASVGSNLSFTTGTLDTVQNIQTSSSPTFAGLTLSSLTNNALVYSNGSDALSSVVLGSSLALTTGTLDTIQPITTSSSPTFAAIRLTTGASTGYVLTSSDGLGNAVWASLSGIGVTSITGTSGQVFANGTFGSPQTGAVVLTLPQSIATSSSPTFANLTLTGPTANTLTYFNGSGVLSSASVTANLSFSGGVLDTVQGIQTTSTPQFAKLGIGVAAPAAALVDVQGSIINSSPFGVKIEPSLTCNSSASGIVVELVGGTTTVNGSGTNTVDYIQILPNVVASTTVSSYRGLHVSAGTGVGTVTSAYGLYVENPGFGTNKYAAAFLGSVQNTTLTANSIVYANASQVLSSATLTANLTLSGGVLDTVQGIQTTSTPQFAKLGLGVSPTTYNFENVGTSYVHSTGTTYWGEYISNTNVSFGSSAGISLQITSAPNAGTTGNASAAYIWNTYTSSSVSLLNFTSTLTPTATPTAGMILSNSGFLGLNSTVPHSELQTSNALNNRKITLYETSNNAYQYYGFGMQAGTLVYEVDSSSSNHVFYCGSSSSSNTELMRITGTGSLALGGVLPPSCAQLSMNSTTQGFLPPVTVNASVISPVQGLTIYDTGVGTLATYNGSRWTWPVVPDTSGNVTISGALTSATRTITSSPYTMLTSDQNLFVNNTTGGTFIAFPVSPVTGQTYHIMDISGSANLRPIVTTTPVNGNGGFTTLINTAYGKADAIYNGTVWEVSMIPGNLTSAPASLGTLISTQTFAGVTSISFTGLTTYSNYLVLMTNINCGGNILGMQLSTSAGPVYTYATSGYTSGQTVNALANNNWTGIAGSSSYWTFGTAQGAGTQSTSGFAYLYNFRNSATPFYTSTLFGNGFNSIQAGNQTSVTNVTAIQFIPSTGTVSGTISLFGLAG